MKVTKEDTRIPVPWDRAVSTRYLSDLWAKACYALNDLGKDYLLNEMKERIKRSKSQRETLNVIQDYVRFE